MYVSFILIYMSYLEGIGSKNPQQLWLRELPQSLRLLVKPAACPRSTPKRCGLRIVAWKPQLSPGLLWAFGVWTWPTHSLQNRLVPCRAAWRSLLRVQWLFFRVPPQSQSTPDSVTPGKSDPCGIRSRKIRAFSTLSWKSFKPTSEET